MGKGTKHLRDWKETTLQVVVDAKRLFCHSIHIMGNPKCFDPKNDFQNTTLLRLADTFLSIYSNVWDANHINAVKNPNQASERLELQNWAIVYCRQALMLVELAKPLFHLDSRKYWNWANMIVNLGKKLDAWHKSDVERYAESGCKLKSLRLERVAEESESR